MIADKRGTTRTIGQLTDDALALLMRRRVVDAVLSAQALLGEPVTAHQARAAARAPVMRSAHAFSAVATRIVALGPDEHGRVLCAAGRDRNRFALWWVEETNG